MQRATSVSSKIVLLIVVFVIVAGAFIGLTGMNRLNSNKALPAASQDFANNGFHTSNSHPSDLTQPIYGVSSVPGGTTLAQTATASTTVQSLTTVVQSNPPPTPPSNLQPNQQNNSGFVEFFSNVTIQVSSPDSALNQASAVAYSFGGYLAFSFLNNYSAIAVLRIPASNYANALREVESIGNLTGLQSTSNDVRIQYTDLNATLQSLFAEQSSLLKLVNQSTMLNETLLIENQLQQIDAQINSIQSQILQTRLLIDYSTITVTFYKAEVSSPLSLKLTATPQNGLSPLGVTFTTVVGGGSPPYIVNYNFGDGSSYEGQSLIHTFYTAGTYNVTATVTDSSGNAKETWILIHVASPPSKPAFESFVVFVSSLFVSVLEGIVEVAVVVAPIALVAFAVLFPLRSRMRSRKSVNTESKQ